MRLTLSLFFVQVFFMISHHAWSANTTIDSLLLRTQQLVLSNHQQKALEILVPLYYDRLDGDISNTSFQELAYQFVRILERTGQHEQALKESERWRNESSFLPYYKGQMLIVKALVYEKIGNSTECIAALNEVARLIHQNNWPRLEAEYLVRRSSYHRILGNQDSARLYALRALPLALKSGSAWHIGDSYLLLSFTDSAFEARVGNMQKALKAYKQLKDTSGVGLAYLNLFSYYLKNSLTSKAAMYLDSAAGYTKTDNFLDLRSSYYSDLSYFLEGQGRFEESLIAYKTATQLLDEMATVARNALSYSEKYRLEYNQQRELEAIRLDNEMDQDKLREERNNVIFYLVVITVLLGTTLYFYFEKRKGGKIILEDKKTIEKRNKDLEKLLEGNDLLLNELHHRVKNNLQFIISMISLQVENSKLPNVKQALETVLGRVGAIASVHEKLFNGGDTEAKVNQVSYINNIIENLRQIIEVKDINIHFESDEVFLETSRSIALGLIVTELVTNSMKHAFGKNDELKNILISLKSTKGENFVELNFSDNGNNLWNLIPVGWGLILLKCFRNSSKAIQQ